MNWNPIAVPDPQAEVKMVNKQHCTDVLPCRDDSAVSKH